ncbi:hypothetical protein NKH81_26155 [Mesorhizobium sp. M0959]
MPTLVEKPPKGPGWFHDIKYDGYRTQLIIQRGKVQAFTRNGFDWTDRYSPIVRAAAELTQSGQSSTAKQQCLAPRGVRTSSRAQLSDHPDEFFNQTFLTVAASTVQLYDSEVGVESTSACPWGGLDERRAKGRSTSRASNHRTPQ